ncbi:hypothetical protein [Gordonibacter pamelaeae]
MNAIESLAVIVLSMAITALVAAVTLQAAYAVMLGVDALRKRRRRKNEAD